VPISSGNLVLATFEGDIKRFYEVLSTLIAVKVECILKRLRTIFIWLKRQPVI